MQVDVLGIKINAITQNEAIDSLLTFIKGKNPRLIATANAEMIMMAQDDCQLAAILNQADLVVADGAGVVWAARQAGQPVPERVAGYDLAQSLLAKAAERGYRVFFFGGAPGVAQKAAETAVRWYPNLCIAGTRNGFFSALDEPVIIDLIKESKPDILLVALGIPKQEKWLATHLSELAVPVSIGVGGTFDVMAGITRRAPLWMQKAGLEWLFRLGCQPSRLIRMLVLPRFVLRVVTAKKH